MSSEWQLYSLAQVALDGKNGLVDGPFGSNLPEQLYTVSGVPVIRGSNLSKGKERFRDAEFVYVSDATATILSRSQCLPRDIVFTKKGTLGQLGFIPLNKHPIYLLSSNQMRMRVDPSVADPEFVYYYLAQPTSIEKIIRDSEHTGVPKINLTYLREFPIRLPSLPVQIEIVSVLRALDDRIALLRETNTMLEAIAQALFKSWFVDFDPVHAKQKGQTPVGMDEATAALFPDGFEDSELGLAPKGWSVGTLADLAILNAESWTTKRHPKTVQYIDLANVKNNEIDIVAEYLFEDAPSRARRVLRSGDSIIGTVRPGNRSFAYIYQAPGNLTGSTGFAVLRPKNITSSEFVFIASTQATSIDHFAHIADGGAYPAVRPEVIVNLQTILPSEEIVAAFHDVVSPIFARIGENSLQSQTLATLRDTLLPRLISGQLRLPEATELLEGAVA
jgi:type I restriction enzyme S subunit